MQLLCLHACYVTEIESTDFWKREVDVSDEDIVQIFNDAVEFVDHENTVDVLDSGPNPRGTKRNIYQFDGGEGDVYRCILRAIAADPPRRSLEYSELKRRTDAECVGRSPDSSSIIRSCGQMKDLLKDRFPDEHALDWDETKRELHIPDPYLLFYLRWSNHLD